MSDDKRKKKIDGWFVDLDEKYEVDYFVKDIISQLPWASREQVLEALDGCVNDIKPSEGRKRLEACVLAKLRPLAPNRPDKDDRPKHPSRTHA